MSTTSLFVELIVIGSGAGLLVAGLVLGALGRQPAWPGKDAWIAAAVPVLSMIYVLGILVDRLADRLLLRITPRPKEKRAEIYERARTMIYAAGGGLRDVIEYSRSRLRISRGWIVNGVLLGAVFPLYARRVLGSSWPVTAGGVAAFWALAAGAFFAWRGLAYREYERLEKQYHWLHEAGLLK